MSITRPALCMLLVFTLLGAAAPPPRALADDATPADAAEPALWELMEAMGEHLRLVKQLLGKDDGLPEAADRAAAMVELAVAAKAMTPPKIAEMEPGAKRDEAADGYRRAMIGLVRQLLDLETALLDGQKERAFELIDALVESRFKGHLKYKSD